MPCEFLPGFDPIEDLEEQRSEEHLLGRLGPPIDHICDQVLANTVRCSVDIRKSMSSQDRVISPWSWFSVDPSHEEILSFDRESPVCVKDMRGLHYITR